MFRTSKGSLKTLLLGTAALALGLSCGGRQTITKVGNYKYRLSCKTSLSDCLGQVEIVCDEGFKVLSASDDRDRYGVKLVEDSDEVRSSTALVRCHSKALVGGDPEQREPNEDEPQFRLEREEDARACVPGSSMACVGPAGCSGGQTCNRDGSAYGPCDCGPPAAATTSAPTNSASPPASPRSSASGPAPPPSAPASAASASPTAAAPAPPPRPSATAGPPGTATPPPAAPTTPR